MNSDRMFLKAKAINYFLQTNIPKSVENCLNDLFKVNPSDPYGYLSKYFEELSILPTVSRVEARESTGDICCNAISIKIFGMFRNQEMELARISVPNNVSTSPGVCLTINNIRSHNDIIKQCVSEINDHLVDLLIGVDPRNCEQIHNILRLDAEEKQSQYEEQLREKGEGESNKEEVKGKVESAKKSTLKKGPPVVVIPDNPPEVICPLLRAHSALSMALAMAAAKVDQHSPSEHIWSQMNDGGAEVISDTLPMVALLRNGKGLPGKCQWIKRVLLVPNGLYGPSGDIAAHICLLSLTIVSNLQTKNPMVTVSDHGEIVPSFDRAEQFIEVIQDALKECELEEKMRVVVEVSARGFFDMEKGKYEVVQGQMKSGEEFMSMMVDFVERYPVIVGLVDPLRTQDKDNWRSLSVSVSSHCWVMGRYPHSIGRVSSLVKDDLSDCDDDGGVSMSVVCVSMDGYSLYDQYLACGRHFSGQHTRQKMCLWLDDLSTEQWLLELACGLRVALVALPAVRSVSGAHKIDQWASLLLARSSSTPGSCLSFTELYHKSETPSNDDNNSV